MPQLEQSLSQFASSIGGEFDLTPLQRDGCLSLQFDDDKTLFIETAESGTPDKEVLLSLQFGKRALDDATAKAALARCLPQKVGFQLSCGRSGDRQMVLVARVGESELEPQRLEAILQSLFSLADELPGD